MAEMKIKAAYHTTGPFKEPVTYTKCWMDKTEKSLQQEVVTEEMDVYHVRFPMGHSIRITDFKELKRLGYHIKPRMVDLNTGDVVDAGGDPYDFGSDPFRDADVVVMDDAKTKSTTKKNEE